MKKRSISKKLLGIVLSLLMVLVLAACGGGSASSSASKEEAEPEVTESSAPAEEEEAEAAEEPEAEPAEEEAEEPAEAGAEDPNAADYEYLVPAGEAYDLAQYYKDAEFDDCHSTYTGMGGVVNVPDDPTTPIPKANEPYTIGFSVYYTVDEVGAMILDNMKKYAQEAGVELLVNDANYDQNLQNQAVEQWIVEGVDGVIIAPCDFYGVQGALDACTEAGIPAVTLNPALEGSATAGVLGECVEQGRMAGELLLDELLAKGSDMKGIITISTLNFVHPNAATREKGFRDAFADYPDIEFKQLTGVSPEDHYTLFEGALTEYGDELLGAFGLYSSATIGVMNAAQAAGSDVPITSIDNDKVILEGINDGKLLGSACYSSTAPAFWCMSAMVNLLNGVEVPCIYWYANMKVTKDNVAEAFEHYHGQTLDDYLAGN